MRISYIIFLAFLWISLQAQSEKKEEIISSIDPLIGTDWGGNVFPGVTLPNGLVKLGPDCDNNPNAGWDAQSRLIEGFSHTHTSGTGGGAKYGNILVQPFTGEFEWGNHASDFSDLSAEVGCLRVNLNRYQIKATLSASSKAGFHEYIFPRGVQRGILFDTGHFLTAGKAGKTGEDGAAGDPGDPGEENQQLVGSEIQILSPTEIQGYTRVRNGWNRGGAYTVYFYACMDSPAENYGVWENDTVFPSRKEVADHGLPAGAWFSFATSASPVLKVKVGLSYVSQAKAKENLYDELPGWGIEQVIADNKNTWNRRLNSIQIETKNETYRKMFYTALYHSLMMPVDKTDENPKWKLAMPYYDDYYAVWDTYRTTSPLLTIIAPSLQVRLIQSMLNIYTYEGYLPDGRSGDDNGRTQGGSNADIVLADAYVKGLTGIDYETALKAMLKNAEVAPGGDERKEGRGGLAAYNRLGYVPACYERSVTRTLEYATCDYAITTLAKGLGKDSLAVLYGKRAHNWKNIWRPFEDHGAKGFAAPRKADGNWKENFHPMSAGSWPDDFYESHSWELSFYVPQDVKALISYCGGRKAFENRLDTFFINSKPSKTSWVNDFFNVNNEPGFLTPCLYHWIGKPEKSADRVREIVKKHFGIGQTGLPGNDDSGALSSFLAFHLMGFYPVAGQDVYLLAAPHLEQVSFKLENGKTYTLQVKNLTDTNRYIQKVILNGKPFTKNWFDHQTLLQGGIMDIYMGPTPSDWGHEGLPPSLSDFK